jgi:ABC-type nitrate/sulfonate/bicarbonate transport system permease component
VKNILALIKKIHGETWIVYFTAVFLAILWQISVVVGWLTSPFFPAPSAIFKSAVDMIRQGELQSNMGITLIRLSEGFLIGVFSGMIVGLAMGWSKTMRLLLDPVISFIYPIPKIAILPLIMLLIGIGEHTLILIIALSAFFPVVINCLTGILDINPVYFDIAKNYGANRLKIFTKVIFPGCLSMTLAGVRLALGMSLMMVIVVEMTMSIKGIGAVLWLSWSTLRVERIYVALAMIAAVSLLINPVLKLIFSHLAPWKDQDTR